MLPPALMRRRRRSGSGAQILISDTFTRGDSAVSLGSAEVGGGAWTVVAGAWGISSNQAYNPTPNNNAFIYQDPGVADVTVACTFAVVDDSVRLVVRATDNTNAFYIKWNPGAAQWQFFRIEAGTENLLGSYSTVATNGVRFSIACSGTTYNVYADGVLVIGPITDAFQSTATKCGLGNGPVTSAPRWDNFVVTKP